MKIVIKQLLHNLLTMTPAMKLTKANETHMKRFGLQITSINNKDNCICMHQKQFI